MLDARQCIHDFDQRRPLSNEQAALLGSANTSELIQAALLARLIHRHLGVAEHELLRQYAQRFPALVSLLRGAFPTQCAGLPDSGNPPNTRWIGLFCGDWPDDDTRRRDITAFVTAIADDSLPANETAVWLGTVMERGLSRDALRELTFAMRDSGRVYDYRTFEALCARKFIRRYPTGALSEKTALILPSVIVRAARNFPVSSSFLVARSLGFTGGTWDKLSAIPGFRFPLPGVETASVIERCGVAMTVTHGDLNPADRKLYQLRSASHTIESFELIISSIASKQLALPADHLLMDVRYGEGAFLGSEEQARRCADALTELITNAGTPCTAVLIPTEQPNGLSIGNALEVAEAIAVMTGSPSEDWDPRALYEQRELVLRFFDLMMSEVFGRKGTWSELARQWFDSGEVIAAFKQLLRAHEVTEDATNALIDNPMRALDLSASRPVHARTSGRLVRIDQRRLGHIVNFTLGAGGNNYTGPLSIRSGVKLSMRVGDQVTVGDSLCWIFEASKTADESIEQELRGCFDVC